MLALVVVAVVVVVRQGAVVVACSVELPPLRLQCLRRLDRVGTPRGVVRVCVLGLASGVRMPPQRPMRQHLQLRLMPLGCLCREPWAQQRDVAWGKGKVGSVLVAWLALAY